MKLSIIKQYTGWWRMRDREVAVKSTGCICVHDGEVYITLEHDGVLGLELTMTRTEALELADRLRHEADYVETHKPYYSGCYRCGQSFKQSEMHYDSEHKVFYCQEHKPGED